jgi:3-(3-hydroxy-phenyl)propionate hydroxylase
VLISLYRAHCLKLDAYRHERVLFAGDAAHLVPIFGVRGLNSGFDDAGNLAWKLAAVLRGEGGEGLLDSYSGERVFAARENIRAARKSTLFMTPPTRGHALMREAALSLAVSQDFARALVNPRQSSAIAFPHSPLQTAEQGEWAAGPQVGATLPSLPMGDGHVQAMVGPSPTVLAADDMQVPAGVRLVRIDDPAVRAALGMARPGAGYLVRPDGHVAWRWQDWDAAGLAAALRRMMGR